MVVHGHFPMDHVLSNGTTAFDGCLTEHGLKWSSMVMGATNHGHFWLLDHEFCFLTSIIHMYSFKQNCLKSLITIYGYQIQPQISLSIF